MHATRNAKPKTTRKRTPTPMIRPKVQEVLAQVLTEDKLPPRREIAERAGISQQTLYTHALDLVETTEKAWAANRAAPTKTESKARDKEEILLEKDAQIKRLEQRVNEVTERMEWMMKAVQQYAPKALPAITKVLSPTYRPDEED